MRFLVVFFSFRLFHFVLSEQPRGEICLQILWNCLYPLRSMYFHICAMYVSFPILSGMTEIPVLEFTGVAANLYLTPGKNSDSAILLCNRKRRRQIQHALYSFFFSLLSISQILPICCTSNLKPKTGSRPDRKLSEYARGIHARNHGTGASWPVIISHTGTRTFSPMFCVPSTSKQD